MNITVSTAPVKQPLLLSEAKEHLQVVHDRDNNYIGSLIRAATLWAESFTGRKFITQTLTVELDASEATGSIQLPYSPVSTLTSFSTYDTEGTLTAVLSDYYYLSGTDPAFLVPNNGGWGLYRVRKAAQAVYVVGYGASGASMPDDIIHALKIVVADLYHNQESVTDKLALSKVPMSAEALLGPYRVLTY
jgi:uncharacterized phiE125 gp8 family phage protein